MAISEIKTKAEFDQLLKEKRGVAVQASATWCGPCKAITPFFEKAADAHKEKTPDAVFAKFDIEEVPELAQELGISSIPAFFFFIDGNKTKSLVGGVPPPLNAAVDSFTKEISESGLKTDENF